LLTEAFGATRLLVRPVHRRFALLSMGEVRGPRPISVDWAREGERIGRLWPEWPAVEGGKSGSCLGEPR
jgi:hypothetical protein